MWNPSAPIVVGIDGSAAAVTAAQWAVDEAISRDVPLRMVHAIHIEQGPDTVGDGYGLEIQYAEEALRTATAAVESMGKQVKIEAEILWGSVETALIGESRHAAMMCVGSTGIGAVAGELLGSTAVALAENAYSPVAIIRTPHDTPPDGANWIAVAVEDRADNEIVMKHAMDEARLRQAPVLAIGVRHHELGQTPADELVRRLEDWKRRYPDVHIYPVATRSGVARFLAANQDISVQLAVLGGADARQVAQIVGPHSRPLVRHVECSVLVVH